MKGLSKGKQTAKKRKALDVPFFLDKELFNHLKNLVNIRDWKYKSHKEFYKLRDKAIICFFILTGCRASESAMRKGQLKEYHDYALMQNVKTLKNGNLRKIIKLPKTGSLSYFTNILLEYWAQIPHTSSFIFPSGSGFKINWDKPLSRYRIHKIVHYKTLLFPHWFRAVHATIYAKLVFNKDAWKLKQYMGWARLGSSASYIAGSYEEDLKEVNLI